MYKLELIEFYRKRQIFRNLMYKLNYLYYLNLYNDNNELYKNELYKNEK